MPPAGTPIGLQLAHSAKHVARAFNDALAGVGGSMPTWFILTNLKGDEWRTQHELARALHIEGPTLTRHLDGLEEEGLVVRRRDPHDRRAVSVELTEAGRAKHDGHAAARCRPSTAGCSPDQADSEIGELRVLLGAARAERAGELGVSRFEEGHSRTEAATRACRTSVFDVATGNSTRKFPRCENLERLERQSGGDDRLAAPPVRHVDRVVCR